MGLFGPQMEAEEPIFAEEGARVDAQHMLQRRMNECGVTEDELAKRMGVPVGDIKRVFASEGDIGVKFIARALWAIDRDKLDLSTVNSTSRSGVRRINVKGR